MRADSELPRDLLVARAGEQHVERLADARGAPRARRLDLEERPNAQVHEVQHFAILLAEGPIAARAHEPAADTFVRSHDAHAREKMIDARRPRVVVDPLRAVPLALPDDLALAAREHLPGPGRARPARRAERVELGC